ncbi:MAG TPA: PorV/PorQ family protein [bacterium]|nr:PorV/PorQ family protein [bacterium]
MKLRLLLMTSVLAAILMPPRGWADAGYTSANFLKLGMGARAIGMANSFTAVADDATAVYWNPAGLDQTWGTQLSLTHSEYLQGVKIDFLSLSQSLGEDGALGIGFSGLGLQPFLATLEGPGGSYAGTGGTVNVSDWALSVGYANRLGKLAGSPLFQNTLVGLKVNVLSQNESGPTGTAFSVDAGALQLFPKDHVSLGLDVQNLGSAVQQRGQPALFKAGAAWYALRLLDPTDRLTLAVDTDIHSDTGFEPSLGAEYGIGLDREDRGFLRAGLRTTDNQFGFSFMTLGAGLERDFSDFVAQLDYALVPYGTLGATHWFTLNVRLGREQIHANLAGPKLFHLDAPAVRLNLGGGSDAPIDAWVLSVTDRQGNLVRTYSGDGALPKNLDWDGKDAKGQLVAPGTYVARLQVHNQDGQSAQTAPVAFRAIAPLSLAEFKWNLKSDGIFDTAQADLLPLGRERLTAIEKGLQKYFLESQVEIQGYTDNKPCRQGPHCKFKNNQELSEARAKTVHDLFVSLGLKPENVTMVGLADAAPVAPNDTPAGRSQNRRIAVVVKSATGGQTPQTLMNAGLFLMDNGLNDQAIQLFQMVADYEPDHPEAWRLVGTCLFKMNRLAEAAEAGKKADEAENFQP